MPSAATDEELALVDVRSCGYTRAELALLRQRDVLRPVLGPWWAPQPRVLDARTRLAALSLLQQEALPAAAVFSHATAAWAWVGGPAPARTEARAPRVHRAAGREGLPITLRAGIPGPREIAVVEGVRLTTPLHTALEMMSLGRWDAVTLRRLVEASGLWGLENPPRHAVEALGERRRAAAREGWHGLLQAFRSPATVR